MQLGSERDRPALIAHLARTAEKQCSGPARGAAMYCLTSSCGVNAPSPPLALALPRGVRTASIGKTSATHHTPTTKLTEVVALPPTLKVAKFFAPST